jgi:parvulin-like peptidyl-prolyl isomerase
MDRRWMVLVGALLAGCGPQAGDSTLLARVGDTPIFTDDLQRLADRRSTQDGDKAVTVDYRDQLQTLVDRQVLLLDARSRGLDVDSMVQGRLAAHEEEGLVREMLHRQVTARLTITPEEVESEYERGGWGLETQCMEIFVSTPHRVQTVLDSMEAGANFSEIGRLYSEDRLFKIPVGAPQFTSYAPKDPPRRVAEAVSSLPVGQVVGPLDAPEGFVFAKVLERLPVSLEVAESKITKWLQVAKREALRDVYYISLQKSFGLELDQQGMDRVLQCLQDGTDATSLSEGERHQPVYTYRGGALEVAEALSRLQGQAGVDEDAIVESLRKDLRRRLVLLDARVQGLDKTEGFARWSGGRREDLMLSRLRSLLLETELTVTEQDIQSQYEKMKDRLQRPGIARVLDLLVPDPDRARALRQEIEAGGDMADLIARHSTRQGTSDGVIQVHDGETGAYGEAWLKAVMSAPLDQLQGPIQARGGFSLFRVLEREVRSYYSLENPRIRRSVQRALMESRERILFNELLERLLTQHAGKIEVFDRNLAAWEDEYRQQDGAL